jgi:hypothetical protein
VTMEQTISSFISLFSFLLHGLFNNAFTIYNIERYDSVTNDNCYALALQPLWVLASSSVS